MLTKCRSDGCVRPHGGRRGRREREKEAGGPGRKRATRGQCQEEEERRGLESCRPPGDRRSRSRTWEVPVRPCFASVFSCPERAARRPKPGGRLPSLPRPDRGRPAASVFPPARPVSGETLQRLGEAHAPAIDPVLPPSAQTRCPEVQRRPPCRPRRHGGVSATGAETAQHAAWC